MIKINSTKRGFTLLEMLVSLGVFAIVAVIAVGALVRITILNRQAQTLQSSMNNIAFAMESISRDLRVGTNYACEKDVSNIIWSSVEGSNLGQKECVVDANPSGNRIIAYDSGVKISDEHGGTCDLIYAFGFFQEGTIWSFKKAQQSSCGENLVDDAFYPIIDEGNTNITGYELGLNIDPLNSGSEYPVVFLRMKGYAGVKEKERSYFDIQTSVSQRTASIGI